VWSLSRGKLELAVAIILFSIILWSPLPTNSNGVASASPSSPHEGTGLSIDIHEFASSLSVPQNDEENGSTFIYPASLYPSGYRGYRLQANVSQIERTTDPIPNGSFEDPLTFEDTWNLTNLEPSDPLVNSVSPVTGQDPQDGLYVMDVEFPYKKILGYRTSYIDNEFNYTSIFIPNNARLLFDIRLSADITHKNYYQLTVTVWNQGINKGEWTTNLQNLWDSIGDQWSAREITTSNNINGGFLLRIMLEKTTDKNEDAKGHIYFDNFRYIIGSQVSPTEANLTLNGKSFINSPTGQTGSVDIYANENLVEAIPFANCWSTDQSFQVYSPTYSNLTFDYEYSMYVKTVTSSAATTSFSAPINGTPIWQIQYTVPSGRPPTPYERYSFGLHLYAGWAASSASGSLGPLSIHLVHPATNFVKIGDDEAEVSELCSIYATSQNYVKDIILQKGTTPTGPWANLSSSDYYLQNEYIRIIAELESLEASPSNFGNVSIYYPNGTIWHNEAYFNFADTLVSNAWQHTNIDDAILGQQWTVTVAFDNDTQCGNRQARFIVVIDTNYTRVGWTDGTSFMWGDSLDIEVIWNNSQTHTPITDADIARVRYLDRNLVIQYITMSPTGVGYSTSVPTTLMRPNPTAIIYVELFRYGCVNNSFSEGTAISFTFTLINTIDLVMIKPTQNTGPYQYTGETSAAAGYTSIVKFFDPYQNAYVLDESATWPDVIVNYTRYDDPTGPTGWTFVGIGEFTHNPVDRTFSKNDPSYGSLERVRYNVSMRIEGTSWEYETHQFIIILNIVTWATDLDALRTAVDYPPTGDGWSLFDQTADNYEVHLYWNELLNVTVFYHFEGNTTGISSADSRQIQVGLAPLEDMIEIGNGYYYYIVDTGSLTAGGITQIFVNTTKTGHASQTILIRLFVENRKTQVTTDLPSSTIILPWNGTFALTINYSDIVTGFNNYIIDAPPFITTDPGLFLPTYQNWNNGTYTVIFNGTANEGTYSVLLNFSKNNYQTKLLSYELTIRSVFTLGFGYASPPNIPWSDTVNITLTFYDSDFDHGIPGALITFPGQGIWELYGTDYWITDYNNGTYLLILNTMNVPEGIQTYTLTITFAKQHYQTTQTVVPFQVTDIQTILLITDTPNGTFIPHGDLLIIVVQFTDTSHSPFTPILNATIGCNWNPFFYSVTQNGSGVYTLRIQTAFNDEGIYQLNIWAEKSHFHDGNNILVFRIEEIQTAVQANPDSLNVPIGDNATFTLTYLDLDHPGTQIPNANVTIHWVTGFYSITDNGDGTYFIQVNTTTSSVGTHILQVDVAYLHHEAHTIFITLEITRIQLAIQVLEPATGRWDVDYNTPVNITAFLTDHLGNPVNDALVEYSWASRGWASMTWIGNGFYFVAFLANASVGADHPVTIRASNITKYVSVTDLIMIRINPTAVTLIKITPQNRIIHFGDPFLVSVFFATDPDNQPIDEAIVTYVFQIVNGIVISTGTLVNVGSGIYNLTIDTTGLTETDYILYLSASKETMGEGRSTFGLRLIPIPTEIVPSQSSIPVLYGTPFKVSVYLNDTHNALPIFTADLSITIANLAIFNEMMENHNNGTYTYEGFCSVLGLHPIQINASAPYQYDTPAILTIYLEGQASPVMQNLSTYLAAGAVLIVILLILWLAYVRVFSVPWMVRKMRKMANNIGKGATPTLSKVDHRRISDRAELMSEIAHTYYGSVGLPVTNAVIPVEIAWEEREAEDEAIWSELKGLPYIEYEQKLELFQQMKQMPPSERSWFIQDLKKQMADGTRFARKPKEPEISKDFEKELQARLATFPALSKVEKERIAAQLRKMPKEDWDEIFQTLAIAGTPKVVIGTEKLRPDEFPSLTVEERQKVLEEIKGLSDEERQKVLKTFREKRTDSVTKGKVIKEKKDFVIDESEDEK
jgi:hypothetical protein